MVSNTTTTTVPAAFFFSCIKGRIDAPFRFLDTAGTIAGAFRDGQISLLLPVFHVRARGMKQADRPDAFERRSACSCACAAVLAMGSLSRPANR